MRLDRKLEDEVAAIGDLSRKDLAARWVKTYNCPPPKGIKRGLLERSAAWHLQAGRLGGLSQTAKRAIRAASSSAPSRSAVASRKKAAAEPNAHPTLLRSGTRLMREWNGRMHVVDI